MTGGRFSGAVNLVALCVFVLVVWQALYFIAGDIAMRSPAETLAYSVKLFAAGGASGFMPLKPARPSAWHSRSRSPADSRSV